jgi:hypothetical protein
MTTISERTQELAGTLTTTEQALALNDLIFELEGRKLISRDESISALTAASVSVRTDPAVECASCPHDVHTCPESLGSEELIFPTTEDAERAVPRDPRSPHSRRSKLRPAYSAALQLVEQRAPEAAQPIRLYVITLRDECARTRIRLRDLRARLERGAS